MLTRASRKLDPSHIASQNVRRCVYVRHDMSGPQKVTRRISIRFSNSTPGGYQSHRKWGSGDTSVICIAMFIHPHSHKEKMEVS